MILFRNLEKSGVNQVVSSTGWKKPISFVIPFAMFSVTLKRKSMTLDYEDGMLSVPQDL